MEHSENTTNIDENKKSDKDLYYEEVLSTAALALSNSKSKISSPIKSKCTTTCDELRQETVTHNHEDTDANDLTASAPNSKQPFASSDLNGNLNNKEIKRVTNTKILAKEDAALLSSLPQRPIANFPSESDRKRVMGMLATIISMTYQYEESGTMDYSPMLLQSDDIDEDKYDDLEEDYFGTESATGGSSKQDQDDDMFEDLWERTSPIKAESSESPQSPDVQKLKDKQKFAKNLKHQESDTGSTISNSSKKPSATARSASKHNMEDNIALKRHRRRRHTVYSEFFVLSADLMFLDKSNAIAFLPLLNSLLGSDAPHSNGIEEGFKVATNMIPMKEKDTTPTANNDDTQGSNDKILNYKNEADSFLLREWSSHITIGDSGSNSKTSPTKCEDSQDHQPWDKNDILLPFVESLESGAGFQCLSLLLSNYLLQSEQGYDARIRACIKKLGVIIFIHELKHSDCDELDRKLNASKKLGKTEDDCLADMATRKFESLEHTIATKLLRISAAQQQQKAAQDAANKDKKSRGSTKDKIVRGLKIGTAGVAAGTLMALTGGLAAPGIAAGLAATGITTAATAGVVTTLTSTVAVTTIFGVGGGSLAAYKTHRRTKGVTEFTFQKQGQRGMRKDDENAELFSTICISGWLKDDKDFERPWGVEPCNPPITDRMEKLLRFYAIYKPTNIGRCQEILDRWKGEYRELWALLKQKYGRDPDHLYPMFDSPHRRLQLTHEEDEVVDNLLGELGYVVPVDDKRKDSFHKAKDKLFDLRKIDSCIQHSFSNGSSDAEPNQQGQSKTKKFEMSLWDYQIEYGGELLTVRWESDMLVELCDSVSDMAADMVGQAAREILKQTALATLITAVALPYAIVRAADMIDGIWTLAIERADLAGIELANSLLDSEAGHRPVVLVGFSMGARTIYSCLKELARQQEIWEGIQEEITRENTAKKRGIRRGMRNKQGKSKQPMRFTREPASIIEDAIMMGLPNHLSLHSWESCRRIVAGRLVNCYSKNDMILSLMFQIKRLSGALRPVCGTSPVSVRGVENYNVTSLIKAHSDYCTATSHILRMVYHGSPHRASATFVVPSEVVNDDT